MKRILFISCAIAFIGALSIFGGGCKKNTTVVVINPGDTTWKHLRDSLWAYYPFNGNTNDSTPGNHALVLSGGAALSDDMWGNPSHALDLPGGAAYGSIADGANFNPKAFSFAFYVMPRIATGFYIGKQDYATSNGAIYTLLIDPHHNPDSLAFNMSTNPSPCQSTNQNAVDLATSSSNLPVYRWHQVVVTFHEDTMKMYLNGALIKTSEISLQTPPTCTNGQLILGNWWQGDNTQAANCKMMQLRIYTRALTDNEVSFMYAQKL